jgi:NTP pyrophosphatase (non-canonical NTP hydrolase)
MDSKTNIQELKDFVRKHCEERDWDQYHSPKELSIGLITEASELLEQFRFKTDEQMAEILNTPKTRLHVEEEIGDVFFFLLCFCEKYDIDLSDAFKKKMELNEKKYPIEKAKGLNKKYSEYE